ncbi:MAG TPA: SGNH hydrolase domain-containing protein, partial [Caulobacteraceae bacterium]
ISRAAYDAEQAVANRVLERLRARYGFTILRPQDVLCASGGCALMQGGRSLYQDRDHLSPPGALAVVPAFEPLWRAP